MFFFSFRFHAIFNSPSLINKDNNSTMKNSIQTLCPVLSNAIKIMYNCFYSPTIFAINATLAIYLILFCNSGFQSVVLNTIHGTFIPVVWFSASDSTPQFHFVTNVKTWFLVDKNKSNHQGMQCVLSSLLTESITKLMWILACNETNLWADTQWKGKGHQSDNLINQ